MDDHADKGTPMELYYNKHSYPFDAEQCPCDLHFVEYLEKRGVEGKSIFHFGTGEHHLVGMRNHERGNPNEILAITASYQPQTSRSKEHEAYIDFIVNNPEAANYYKVMFGDIYTLSPSLLPSFDIVTLFHLCEFYNEEKSEYARLDDLKLLDLFLSKLNPTGKILFYTKSAGYVNKGRKAAQLIDAFVSQGRMVIEDEYKTLLICGRPDASSQVGR
jgi:SAM-dependent methyltransferase